MPRRAESTVLPSCSLHPGSLVRRYRGHGPDGPGVYLQCLSGKNERPHFLPWPHDADAARDDLRPELSVAELGVLEDAAAGLTVNESASCRQKSAETVKSQRKSIMMKLGARNITQAVAIAIHDHRVSNERAA